MSRGKSISLVSVIGAAVTLAAMLGATPARADGEGCNQGYRDTTAAERESMRNILETAIRALPTAPEGWAITDDGSVSVTTSLCKDFEITPWDYDFTRSYHRVGFREARDKIMDAAAAEMSADLAAKQPRIDAIMARNNELVLAAMDAGQKGDFDRLDAINEEINAGGQEIQRIYDEGPVPQRVKDANIEATRDLSMQITIAINPHWEKPGYEAQELSVPADAQAAFRWSESDEYVKDDNALVLMGKWKPAGEGSFDLVPRADVAAWAVHAISVQIRADENRLTSTIDAIDWDDLATAFSE